MSTLVVSAVVYMLTNMAFVGDSNQVKGVAESLRTLIPDSAEFKQVDISDTEAIAKLKAEISYNTKTQHIVLASGNNGIAAIRELGQHNNTVISWSGHQVFADLHTIENIADIIALPTSTLPLDKSIKQGTALHVPTLGVPHNITRSSLSATLASSEKSIPKAEKYIVVILGGDAPDDKGKYKYFTEETAKKLANQVISMANGATILVTNSNRTGMHDHATGAILSNHEDETKIDHVSQAFITELNNAGITYLFENFTRGAPSAIKPFLATALATDSIVIATGDSISIAAEVISLNPPCRTYIAYVDSMHSQHITHCEEYHTRNMAGKITLDPITVTPCESDVIVDDSMASTTVARAIVNKLKSI